MSKHYRHIKIFITHNSNNSIWKEFLKFLIYWTQNILYILLLSLHRIFSKKDNNEKKYYLSICVMFKDEAEYLGEWIDFNKACGVDHIYMYDNNSTDDYFPIVKKYIDDGYVELIKWPENHSQMKAYKDCFESRRNETRWMGFIDVDEFICPIVDYSVKDWLKSREKYPNVGIYWKQFGSSGNLFHDKNRYVVEQYTQCWSKLSTFTKVFVNTNYDISKFDNPHEVKNKIYKFDFPMINQYSKLVIMGIHRKGLFSKHIIQLNHYWGQALDKFIERKVNKTDVYHKNERKMAELRKKILVEHELLCVDKDFAIQKYLLQVKSGNYHLLHSDATDLKKQ